MLIYITMKSPDSVSAAQEEYHKEAAGPEFQDILEKYFEYNEYCLLEFNTITGESRVVPNSEQEDVQAIKMGTR